MSKKGETGRAIIDAVSSGKDTRKKLLQNFGWDPERDRQKLSYHLIKLKEVGSIEEYEGKKFRILIEPETIADPKATNKIFNRIRSNKILVRKEGVKDLEIFCNRGRITDPNAYDTIINFIQDPSYHEHKMQLLVCLSRIIVKLRNTEFEKILIEKLKKEEDFLSDTALNTELDEGNELATRRLSIELLTKTNPDKFLEIAFKIIENLNEKNFGEVDARGNHDKSNVIGEYVYRGILHRLPEYQEKAQDELYSLLEKHDDNEIIAGRITMLLDGLRREVIG